MNSKIYEGITIHTHSKLKVSDIWERDRERLEIIANYGYDILGICERDWNKHNPDVKVKIKRFLCD